MKKNILNWMKLLSFIFAFSMLFVSCNQDEMLEQTAQETKALQLVVGDFPAFGGSTQTRASINGTPDAGKTQWEENDQIIITVTSAEYGTQYATLTYNGEEWSFDEYPKYLLGESEDNGSLDITALYAPGHEVKEDAISLKEGKHWGMDEYLEVKCYMDESVLNIPFAKAERNYSRLRIVSPIGDERLWVLISKYVPAGYAQDDYVSDEYYIPVDEKENAYIYGIFCKDYAIEISDAETNTLMLQYGFAETTEPRKSYALDTRLKIDGTWDGKEDATDDDIEELQNFFMSSMDAGRTTFVVTGETQAMYEYNSVRAPFIGFALCLIYGDNDYHGKMHLIFRDVTEIVEEELFDCDQLKTVTFPKVTICGKNAFKDSDYLEKITFGSVVESVGEGAFKNVGKNVNEGCELVLNKDQVAVEGLAPDLEAKTWAGYTWKSITLKQ